MKPMRSMVQNTILFGLLLTTALTVGCSSSKKSEGQGAAFTSYEEGVPGGSMSNTRKITATVTGIDRLNRRVTLVDRDGKKSTVKCGPEVVNFDRIEVGDQVNVTAKEEFVAHMAAPGSVSRDGRSSAVITAPKGDKPGTVIAESTQVTATIKEIDRANQRVTLQYPDGSFKKVAVRPDVDLTQRNVGERVDIRITEALAIAVEKP